MRGARDTRDGGARDSRTPRACLCPTTLPSKHNDELFRMHGVRNEYRYPFNSVPCFGSVLRRLHEISKSLTATNLEYQ